MENWKYINYTNRANQMNTYHNVKVHAAVKGQVLGNGCQKFAHSLQSFMTPKAFDTVATEQRCSKCDAALAKIRARMARK